jgi:DNA-binding CsgD family transcriptional regulator
MTGDETKTRKDKVLSVTIQERLRSLVRSISDGIDRSDSVSEQVLLDIDLDGRRYLLIRMPAIERKSAPLSPREVEIARLVAEGRPNKVIAAVLEISSWTVCTHLRRVFAKLGVNTRAAMVARLIELGGIVDCFPAASAKPIRPDRGCDEIAHEVVSSRLGEAPPLRFGATKTRLAPLHRGFDRLAVTGE